MFWDCSLWPAGRHQRKRGTHGQVCLPQQAHGHKSDKRRQSKVEDELNSLQVSSKPSPAEMNSRGSFVEVRKESRSGKVSLEGGQLYVSEWDTLRRVAGFQADPSISAGGVAAHCPCSEKLDGGRLRLLGFPLFPGSSCHEGKEDPWEQRSQVDGQRRCQPCNQHLLLPLPHGVKDLLSHFWGSLALAGGLVHHCKG